MSANASRKSGPEVTSFHFHSLRTVTSPEDLDAGRKRYCGTASSNQLVGISTDENVRRYLSADADGNKRKATMVNMAIRRTLEDNRDQFPALNAGLVLVARAAEVNDAKKTIELVGASIINGAQTQGVLRDFFEERPEDTGYPSVNFEIVVTDDDELIADISIARNFQNRVADLSIYGRHGLFEDLEKAMRKKDKKVRLRTSESDYDDALLDTEKLIQVLTAICPENIPLPSANKRKVKSAETTYRVYAYRHRSRCLRDFAEVMTAKKDWSEAAGYFLDLASDAWSLYIKLRSEQFFAHLHKVEGANVSGRKIVVQNGVPDGIVFPILSAMSRFIEKAHDGWTLNVPESFPWRTLYRQADVQFKTTAGHNPQTMGKNADCYVALHGAIDMYFDVMAS